MEKPGLPTQHRVFYCPEEKSPPSRFQIKSLPGRTSQHLINVGFNSVTSDSQLRLSPEVTIIKPTDVRALTFKN